jgi:pheromone alpha factor receptor
MSDPTGISSFDPFSQNVTFLAADGVTPINVTMNELNDFVVYTGDVCINFGNQMGAALVMLVVVILITKDSKRRSPLFLINCLTLCVAIVRSLLQALYYVGPWNNVYSEFVGDFSHVPKTSYATSIVAMFFNLFLLLGVELSLLMQTHVVCVTLERKHKATVMGLSGIVSLAAISFRFALMVLNIRGTIDITWSISYTWVTMATLITETISIWFFCIVFVAKLGLTLSARKRMGLRKWGPMEIICIMGGCTMVVPCKCLQTDRK